MSDAIDDKHPENEVADEADEKDDELQKRAREDLDRSKVLAAQLPTLQPEHRDCIRIAREGMLAGMLIGIAAGIAGTQLLSSLWR